MSNSSRVMHLGIGFGLALALAACQSHVPTTVGAAGPSAAAVVPHSPIDWAALVPARAVARRHLAEFAGVSSMTTGTAPTPPPGAIATDTSAMGAGYATTGAWPYYSSGSLGGQPGVYMANPATATVYQPPAFYANTVPFALSRGGGFVGVNTNGQIGILDPRTLLIQTFPQLENQVSAVSADVDAFGDVAYVDTLGQAHLLNPVTQQDFIVPAAGRGLAGISDVSLSGDGRFLAYTGLTPTGTNVFVSDLATGSQFSNGFLASLPGNIQNVQLSADGRSLLFLQNGQLRVLDQATGIIDNLALLDDGFPIVDAQWVGAGNGQIAFTRDGQLQVFDRPTGTINTLPIVNQLGDLSIFSNPALTSFGRFF